MKYDVIIIGAGAAGMMCAATAGKRGRRVLLIDKATKAGEKIRISGGGRCNFTNIHTSPTNYLSQNPQFCVSALRRYPPTEFIGLVERYNIAYHEKTLGQLFCDHSSKQIIEMLLAECAKANVDILLETEVTSLEKHDARFHLTTSAQQSFEAESVVIATGGPSIPKMGSSGWGYKIAEQFDLKLIPPRAALVPFTLGEELLQHTKLLAGISLQAIVQHGSTSFREGLLFTHRGLSGPAILQISSYWQGEETITINLLPDDDIYSLLISARDTSPRQELQSCLAQWLPKKLAHMIVQLTNLPQRKLAECGNKHFKALADAIHRWQITPNGTEGYRTAEVTLGGVDTDELSSQSFESHKVSGLYFIGEVVDVTGHLGGYNFQWAWASGHAAGEYV